MAKTAIVKVNVSVYGDGIDLPFENTALSDTASVLKVETLALSDGSNLMSPPSGASYLILYSGSAAITIEGAAADTGWQIGNGKTALLPLGGGSYYLTVSGAQTVNAIWLG